MKRYFGPQFDRINAQVAIGVWLSSSVVYWLTRAATLSFWDCGEFITAAHYLAIPHPPGSPLWVIIGRLFTLIPISADIGVRLNFLSGFCSAFTALFSYLSAVRILRYWFGTASDRFTRILIYGGAASGALFVAFGLTNWTNSVEAEVYGMSMMILMGILWLTLVYFEERGSMTSERIMLVIVFAAFLSIGVHMTTFLIFPVAALFFIIKKTAPSSTWFAVAVFFAAELYLIFALSSRPNEIPYYLPVAILFLLYLFYIFSFDKIPRMFMWAGYGFMLVMVPLLARAFIAVRGIDPVVSNQWLDLTGMAGLVGFGVLILFGLYCLSKYFARSADKKHRTQLLPLILFTLASVIMVGLLYVPKGYTSFLIISVLMAAALTAWIWRGINWPILVAVVSISTVIIGLELFFYSMLVGTLLILVLGLLFGLPRWKTALMVIVVAALGMSVNLFVPIRSAQQPYLDENNPSESYTATINFLERKQYGSMGMIERMFRRRAEWSHQFGVYQRMGFWNFFHQQYGLVGPKFVFLFLLGLFGLWEIVRRRPRVGLPFVVLLLISTAGLVLYMNFADGTRQLPNGSDYIEVRERDYFFTPGFILFGLSIGLGSAIALQYLREAVARFSLIPRKIVMASSLVLLLLPSFALAQNYYLCDRSRNYMPYDYAWNLLSCADENAILFTNGDNDTFPLWCLQGVYGVRTDVTIVNLALANTKWYIKQVQSSLGLDLGWSESHIDGLRPFHVPDSASLDQRQQYVDKEVYAYLRVSDREMDSLYRLGVPYNTTFRLNSQVMDKIIYSYLGKRPINYAVSVGGGPRRYLGRSVDTMLSLSGMMWRLSQAGGGQRTDIERSIEFFTGDNGFRARGVNDPTVSKNEATRRLTKNYANGFLMVGDALRARGDLEQAQHLVARAVELIPHSAAAVEFLAAVYAERGMIEPLSALLTDAQAGDKRWLQTLLARTQRSHNLDAEAEDILSAVLAANPDYRPAFEELMRFYFETNRVSDMKTLLQQWLQTNPNDQRVRAMLAELQRGLGRPRPTLRDSQ